MRNTKNQILPNTIITQLVLYINYQDYISFRQASKRILKSINTESSVIKDHLFKQNKILNYQKKKEAAESSLRTLPIIAATALRVADEDDSEEFRNELKHLSRGEIPQGRALLNTLTTIKNNRCCMRTTFGICLLLAAAFSGGGIFLIYSGVEHLRPTNQVIPGLIIACGIVLTILGIGWAIYATAKYCLMRTPTQAIGRNLRRIKDFSELEAQLLAAAENDPTREERNSDSDNKDLALVV